MMREICVEYGEERTGVISDVELTYSRTERRCTLCRAAEFFLLAKTFVMVYTLGNDQAADMLQNSIILLLVLELISKEDADEALQDISEGKNRKAQSFILSCLEKKLMIRFKN